MKTIKTTIYFLVLSVVFFGCGFRNVTVTTNSRIKHFEQIKLNTDQPVEVLWTENLVPRIKAENSKDLFYTLGAVQVHLRRNQLEMYRKLSEGGLSEMAGPVTIKIDRFLKSIDFQHAAEISYNKMSRESIEVLEWMALGINDYIKQSKHKSKDLKIMAIKDKPWTALDLVRVIKFTSVDVNWMILTQLLEFKSTLFLDKIWSLKTSEKDFFDEFLKEINLEKKEKLNLKADIDANFDSSLKTNDLIAAINDLNKKDHSKNLNLSFVNHIQNVTKSGSNAFAVQGSKTNSKSAIVSNDPHLGLVIPNIWLFVILDSPDYKSMGYVIPSFPVPVIGRNADIAWGGTNLWGLSTFPLTLNEDDRKHIVAKKVPLKVRFWFNSKLRTYKLGEYPVLRAKDFPQLGDKDIVFRWQGFHASDELATFLKVNRAKNFKDFHESFESYAVAGMTFVYGDKQGNVGKVIALAQPQVERLKVFYQPSDFKDTLFNTTSLPVEYNPESQFVASANNYTKGLRQPLSLFQAPNDRIDRMSFLLRNKSNMSLEDVKELHRDVYSDTAYHLKNDLVKFILAQDWLLESDKEYISVLDSWGGSYDVESKGALFFELFLASWSEDIIKNLVLKDLKSSNLKSKAFDFLTKNFDYRKFLSKSLLETDFMSEEKFRLYVERAKLMFNKYDSWGDFHRMDLRHPLGNLKLFKYNYSYFNEPWPGGNETLMKAAHKLSTKTAKVSFGAQARWMTDLSSLDENYLVYLGGQDGYIGSENINDLTDIWVAGDYLRVPFDRDEFKKISASNGQ